MTDYRKPEWAYKNPNKPSPYEQGCIDTLARIERIIKSMAPHGWDDAGSFVLRDDVLAAIRKSNR
jgi:hypothetical protein